MNRKRGFTIVELLVAMSVILILAGMLFLGMKFMTASTKKNTTRTMLQNLKAMVTERELPLGATKNKADIDALFTTAGAAASDASVIGVVETGMNAQRYPTPAYYVYGTPLAAGENAVGTTQYVIAILSGIPANKNVIATLPKQQFLEPLTVGTPYNPPIIMDGYYNPIIAVPSTGLANVYTNWKHGDPVPGTLPPPVRSPDGKPFFASAGPDGDFQSGDDNVYSFEN